MHGGVDAFSYTGGEDTAPYRLGMIAPRVGLRPWPTERERVAKCFALRGHEAPYRDCNCGWSAYYSLAAEPELPAPECVWGAVVAWGTIVECETGFRAQFARPLALLDRENPDDLREQGRRAAFAAEAYGIPLLERDELIAYAHWHGEVRMTAR